MAISSSKKFRVGLEGGSGKTKIGKVGGSGGNFNGLISKLGKNTSEDQDKAFSGSIGRKLQAKGLQSGSGDKITKRT